MNLECLASEMYNFSNDYVAWASLSRAKEKVFYKETVNLQSLNVATATMSYLVGCQILSLGIFEICDGLKLGPFWRTCTHLKTALDAKMV